MVVVLVTIQYAALVAVHSAYLHLQQHSAPVVVIFWLHLTTMVSEYPQYTVCFSHCF